MLERAGGAYIDCTSYVWITIAKAGLEGVEHVFMNHAQVRAHGIGEIRIWDTILCEEVDKKPTFAEAADITLDVNREGVFELQVRAVRGRVVLLDAQFDIESVRKIVTCEETS